MKPVVVTLFAAGLLLLTKGCTVKGTPIFVLATPQFVSQSQPDSTKETGVGQDPNTGGIFLQWYTTEGAAGYRLYRSDTTDSQRVPADFLMIGNTTSSAPSVTLPMWIVMQFRLVLGITIL